jgi:ribonuclease HI
MNGHNPWWNSAKSPLRSDTLVYIMQQQDFSLLNEPNVSTYHSRCGRFHTVIDLTFTSPTITNNCLNWSIDQDNFTGSDHEIIRFDLISNLLDTVSTPLAQQINDGNYMIACSDGSKHQDGTTGSGVFITSSHGSDIQLVLPLGKQAEVFDAKLEGALLAANRCHKIVYTLNNKPISIYIFLDNQAAIQRIGTTSPGPGQTVAIDIPQIASSLQEMGIQLHICWVSGYLAVPGNEISDQLANKAAQMKQPQHTTTTLTHLRRNF